MTISNSGQLSSGQWSVPLLRHSTAREWTHGNTIAIQVKQRGEDVSEK